MVLALFPNLRKAGFCRSLVHCSWEPKLQQPGSRKASRLTCKVRLIVSFSLSSLSEAIKSARETNIRKKGYNGSLF